MSKEEFTKIYGQLKAFRLEGNPEKGAVFIAKKAIFSGPLHEPLTLEGMIELRKTGKFAAMEKADIDHVIDALDVFGDVAVDRGTVKAKLPTGEKTGNYLTVWKKEEGAWKIFNSCVTFRVELPQA